MRSSTVILLSQLAAGALAAPNQPCKKAVCNADNCLRAVRATSASPFPSSATADCSSFMRKTVTPCAATTTTTATVFVTDAPAFVTATAIVDNTQLLTATDIVTSVTTIEDTITLTQTSVLVQSNIIASAVTITGAPLKRAEPSWRPLPEAPTVGVDIKPRIFATTAAASTASTCPATTNAPTSVPKYASACSGTVRYSSACACAGVTGATTTLTQSTVTSTATSTVHVTPTSTTVATLTKNVPVTTIVTQVVPATFETTDATAIIPVVVTVTTDVVVPTTVTVSPPACTSSYTFVVSGGSYGGQFINSAGQPDPNTVTYVFEVFTSDPSKATTFVLRPNGGVYANDIYGWNSRANNLYYILGLSDHASATYQIDTVLCSIDRSSTGGVAGAIGMLSCTVGGAAVVLQSCDNTSNNLLQGKILNSGCSQLQLAAVPLGCS